MDSRETDIEKEREETEREGKRERKGGGRERWTDRQGVTNRQTDEYGKTKGTEMMNSNILHNYNFIHRDF